MSPYRSPEVPAPCRHVWVSYWRPIIPGGICVVACRECGERVSGLRRLAWEIGWWAPSLDLPGFPPAPPSEGS